MNQNPKLIKKAAAVLGAAFIEAIVVIILMKKYDNKVHKKLEAKHDKETAERLTKEFDQKLEDIRKKHKNDKESFKKAVEELCRRFGIDPGDILGEDFLN